MSVIQTDNILPQHSKPEIEFERKLVGSLYVDYTSESDVNGIVNINYRKNKYFWINGNYYFTSDGTNYLFVGGKDVEFPLTNDFFDTI
jgi:hypothetical protein